MIVIVAPYLPPSRSSKPNLGAARKLEEIIKVLSILDNNLILINSSVDNNKYSNIFFEISNIGGVELTEVFLPGTQSVKINKLFSLFFVIQVVKKIKKIGNPQLIWFYNGYAFEMLFALMSKYNFGSPLVLEFEDWHFSRKRLFNPKPIIDYISWRLAANFIDGVFAVNSFLAQKMLKYTNNVELLPGVVPKILTDISKKPPFKNDNFVNVGFFGGLSVEKGADIVYELTTLLPDNYIFHITGFGCLEYKFSEINNKNINYYGMVDSDFLYSLIEKCDVILNPHSSIENMHNGVFPFKVIEAIASGRLLISTKVPSGELSDVLDGVYFVDHDINAFLKAILLSREFYIKNKSRVDKGAFSANQRFDEYSLISKISKNLTIKKNENSSYN